MEKQRLLESNSCFLFRPFHLPPDCLPLKECVLSISQFCGMERDHLVQVAEFLGMHVIFLSINTDLVNVQCSRFTRLIFDPHRMFQNKATQHRPRFCRK